MITFLGYPDPETVTNCIKDTCKVPMDAKINDFGCGSGLLGKELKKAGYTNVDGCDASNGMLKIAKELEFYKDLRQLYLCKDEIPKEWLKQYDVVCSAGLMTTDHCDHRVIHEKMSCLKPDGLGYILFTTRDGNMEKCGYKKCLDELIEQKKLVYIETKTFTRYYNSNPEQCKDERFKPFKGAHFRRLN